MLKYLGMTRRLTVCVFVCTGIDYQYCENWSGLLEVEHHQGEDKMSDKEYEHCHWR